MGEKAKIVFCITELRVPRNKEPATQGQERRQRWERWVSQFANTCVFETVQKPSLESEKKPLSPSEEGSRESSRPDMSAWTQKL